MATKKGLGAKGLGIEALIHNKMEDFESDGGGVMELDLNKIEPNRKQPRKYFDETALEELATSLKNYGMIQPVVVKKNKEGYYELIAGERRWRAAKIAGLTKIPAIIKKWEEGEAFEAALVENLQREDLNPMEEAQSYQRLQEEFGLSQEQIADKVGKEPSCPLPMPCACCNWTNVSAILWWKINSPPDMPVRCCLSLMGKPV